MNTHVSSGEQRPVGRERQRAHGALVAREDRRLAQRLAVPGVQVHLLVLAADGDRRAVRGDGARRVRGLELVHLLVVPDRLDGADLGDEERGVARDGNRFGLGGGGARGGAVSGEALLELWRKGKDVRTHVKLAPSGVISRTWSSYPTENTFPSGPVAMLLTRFSWPGPSAYEYSEPEKDSTRPSARPAMNVPEVDVGARAVMAFEGPCAGDESDVMGAKTNIYVEHTRGLVAHPFVEDVQVARERERDNVVPFCPGVADLLVLDGFAQCPGRDCLVRLDIPWMVSSMCGACTHLKGPTELDRPVGRRSHK